jgi:hypothetical protein
LDQAVAFFATRFARARVVGFVVARAPRGPLREAVFAPATFPPTDFPPPRRLFEVFFRCFCFMG